MKLDFHSERLLEQLRPAFEDAVEDTLDDARGRVRGRTGKFAASLMHTEIQTTDRGVRTEIGSPLASAITKEKGAFIQAKRGPYLVFNAGDGVRKVASVRIPKRPVVTPAGQQFTTYMARRLRQRIGR